SCTRIHLQTFLSLGDLACFIPQTGPVGDPTWDRILLLCMCFAIGITARPSIRRRGWWLRPRFCPRVHMLGFGIALFTIYVSMYSLDTVVEWIVLSLLVCAFLFQCYRIYPYTPLHHMQSLVSERDEPERKFSLIVANIEMGNRNAEIFKQLIRESDPDFIFAAETDAWWTNQLDRKSVV